jgi:hypothetical protein
LQPGSKTPCRAAPESNQYHQFSAYYTAVGYRLEMRICRAILRYAAHVFPWAIQIDEPAMVAFCQDALPEISLRWDLRISIRSINGTCIPRSYSPDRDFVSLLSCGCYSRLVGSCLPSSWCCVWLFAYPEIIEKESAALFKWRLFNWKQCFDNNVPLMKLFVKMIIYLTPPTFP